MWETLDNTEGASNIAAPRVSVIFIPLSQIPSWHSEYEIPKKKIQWILKLEFHEGKHVCEFLDANLEWNLGKVDSVNNTFTFSLTNGANTNIGEGAQELDSIPCISYIPCEAVLLLWHLHHWNNNYTRLERKGRSHSRGKWTTETGIFQSYLPTIYH